MRRKDESIIINDNIELTVVEIKGKSVKLGFTFPNGCSVLRKELHEKIQQEKLSTSDTKTNPTNKTSLASDDS